jgi:hypothetical protein
MRTTSGPTSRNEVVPRGHRDPRLASTGERRHRRVRRGPHSVRAQRLRRGPSESPRYGRRSLPPAVQRPCRSQRRKPGRERPRCARPMWPRARPEGSLTPWLSLSQSVSAMVGRAARSALYSRAIASTFSWRNWPCISRNCRSRSEASSRALCTANVYRKSSRKSCRMLCRSSIVCGSRASEATAITKPMLHLCSAPCKALRFAPPARTRGLRALTVPARR